MRDEHRDAFIGTDWSRAGPVVIHRSQFREEPVRGFRVFFLIWTPRSTDAAGLRLPPRRDALIDRPRDDDEPIRITRRSRTASPTRTGRSTSRRRTKSLATLRALRSPPGRKKSRRRSWRRLRLSLRTLRRTARGMDWDSFLATSASASTPRFVAARRRPAFRILDFESRSEPGLLASSRSQIKDASPTACIASWSTRTPGTWLLLASRRWSRTPSESDSSLA